MDASQKWPRPWPRTRRLRPGELYPNAEVILRNNWPHRHHPLHHARVRRTLRECIVQIRRWRALYGPRGQRLRALRYFQRRGGRPLFAGYGAAVPITYVFGERWSA